MTTDGTDLPPPGPAGGRSGAQEGKDTGKPPWGSQGGDLRRGIHTALSTHPRGECSDLLRLFAVELERAR